MDTAQWPQEIVVKPLEEIVTSTCPKPPRLQPPLQQPAVPTTAPAGGGGSGERKVRPQKDQALNCPRCNSTNTKFCYYNNYSLTQPRYFCKTCRRYWTEGGSLRNIPVGGGSRKNKRSSSSSISCSNSPSNSAPPPPKKQLSDHHNRLISITPPGLTSQNPKFHETQDLNLGFPHGFRSNFTELIQNIGNNNSNSSTTSTSNKNPLLVSSCSANSATATTASITASQNVSALDLLSNNGNSFMGLPIHHQDPSGFAMQDHYKPSTTTLLGFSLDGFHHQLGGVQDEGVNVNGRLLFPFEDLKLPVSSSTSTTNNAISEIDQKHGDAASAGYWTGMLSGGSW